jgi:hypothetical protein
VMFSACTCRSRRLACSARMKIDATKAMNLIP